MVWYGRKGTLSILWTISDRSSPLSLSLVPLLSTRLFSQKLVFKKLPMSSLSKSFSSPSNAVKFDERACEMVLEIIIDLPRFTKKKTFLGCFYYYFWYGEKSHTWTRESSPPATSFMSVNWQQLTATLRGEVVVLLLLLLLPRRTLSSTSSSCCLCAFISLLLLSSLLSAAAAAAPTNGLNECIKLPFSKSHTRTVPSCPPDAIRSLSTEMPQTPSSWPKSVLRQSPVSNDHTRIVWSREPVMIWWCLKEGVAVEGEGEEEVEIAALVDVFDVAVVIAFVAPLPLLLLLLPSLVEEAWCDSCWRMAIWKHWTGAVCPVKTMSVCSVSKSHNRSVVSSEHDKRRFLLRIWTLFTQSVWPKRVKQLPGRGRGRGK